MWYEYKSTKIYISNFEIRKKYKLLILDLDATLITRKNGKIPFYQDPDPNNWIFLGDVKEILTKYNNKGYLIVIMTNQSKFTLAIKEKIISVISELFFNLIVMIFKEQKSKDLQFRKPSLGSLDILFTLLNIEKASYIEDLPFPPVSEEKSTIKKIIVSGDAINVNDEYPPYRWSDVDFMLYKNIKSLISKTKFIRPIDLFPSNEKLLLENINEDVVILMGNQGSGKSTFSKKLAEYNNYVFLNQDYLKTQVKILRLAKENLEIGNKIIIDATNSSIEKRKIWIDLAKSFNLSSSIVWIIKDGYQFNKYRVTLVPNIAYNIYTKNFQEPTNDETIVYKLW